MTEDMTDDDIVFPWYQHRPYKMLFQSPSQDWQVECTWDDAYYESARSLIEGVARGEYLPAVEGVPGLYLFRHYVELALKFIIFHSRWLEDAHTNARFEEIREVKKTHSLETLWDIAQVECHRIMSKEEWEAVDSEFVSKCIQDLHRVDPSGNYFRYHGPMFGVEKDPAKRAAMAQMPYLYVDFRELLAAAEHVHDVLGYLNTYMIETHGQNEEWEAILSSF